MLKIVISNSQTYRILKFPNFAAVADILRGKKIWANFEGVENVFIALSHYEKGQKFVSEISGIPEKSDTNLSQKLKKGSSVLMQNEKNKLF